ncbi:MAG: 1-phosphofructokinase family hexose kinase [Planctomycetota bacterium]|jgi:1-phosphofructokinase family hexose kinase
MTGQTRGKPAQAVVTVTLNPAIDRVIEVPGLTLGVHQKGRQLTRMPAGKGANVSRALATLGVPSIATGLVGRDQLPQYEADLARPEVQPQFLAVNGTTRENVTLIDPVSHTETHIRDAGIEVEAEDVERMCKKLNLLAKPDRVVIFSGSLPPGVTVEQLREMVDICRRASAKVALDVPGEALARVTDVSLWVIKPNVDELAAMIGQPTDSDERIVHAGRNLSRRVRVVIVSCGSAGGYAFIDGAALIGQVALEPGRVVSTVGCGDALLAGFVAAQLRGDDVRTSYRYALAVATAAAVDAVPGHLSLEAVDEFAELANVEPVEE